MSFEDFSDDIYGGDETFDIANLPQQRTGGMPLPPQPGRVLVTLPVHFGIDQVDVPDLVCAVKATFDDINPLIVTQNGVEIPMRYSLHNGPMMVSGTRVNGGEMLYMLIAAGFPPAKASAKGYKEALEAAGGAKFKATVTYRVYCNPNKVIYIQDENEKSILDPQGRKGCGAEFAENEYIKGAKSKQAGKKVYQIPKDPETGLFDLTFQCVEGCGAVHRVFPKLEGYVKV